MQMGGGFPQEMSNIKATLQELKEIKIELTTLLTGVNLTMMSVWNHRNTTKTTMHAYIQKNK